MTLSRRLNLYLGFIFVILAVLCFEQFKETPLLIVGLEAALVALAICGYLLFRQVFQPLEQLHNATHLLQEEEFSVKVRSVGHKEMDDLIQIYNRMVERLRQERIQNREQEYFLQKVLKITRTAVIGFHYDDRIENLNPATENLFGLSNQEMVDRTLSQLKHPLGDALAALEPGKARIIPYQGRRRLKCEHAQFVDRGFYKKFMFINELTEELRQTEKEAYGKLIRIISHEINNSLGAASSLLHSLEHYCDQLVEKDREDYAMALKVLISRADHLQAFMQEYTEVVKLPKPDLISVNLPKLLEQIRVLMEPEMRNRQIQWVWRRETPSGNISMDKRQMELVLINIIKNAIEAMEENGELQLTLSLSENRPHLTIEDSGCGISEDVAASLFTPFYTTKPHGQGIGLTMIAEILNNHGFDYALENRDQRGARFSIWFPPTQN